MKQNKIFTIEEHKQNATLLLEMHHQLNQLLIESSKVYGVISREVRCIENAKYALERVRSQFDSDIMKENLKTDIKELNFYYRG